MVIAKPLPFVTAFVDTIDKAIQAHAVGHCLSPMQRTWLAFCLTATLVTHSICWARFERASLGAYSMAALSWMFRQSKIPWDQLLVASVRVLLYHYGITHGSLVIDETDRPRSKSAQPIASLHKLHDKTSGGVILGQHLVFLLVVTSKVTIPLGVAFYRPAPALTAWSKQERSLKQQGIPRKHRPPKAVPNAQYPTNDAETR